MLYRTAMRLHKLAVELPAVPDDSMDTDADGPGAVKPADAAANPAPRLDANGAGTHLA